MDPGRAARVQLIAATLPVMIAGLILQDAIAGPLRNPGIIATTTISFGLLLWLSDRNAGAKTLTLEGISWKIVLLIGV